MTALVGGLRERWLGKGRGEEGLATVLGAVMVAVLLVVTLMVIDVGAAVSARHRAQSAADLAALAGAASAVDAEAACTASMRIASANSAKVVACSVVDFEVAVRLTVPVRFAVLGPGEAFARARAGPV